MLDEQEFRKHADEALHNLERSLTAAGDEYGFESDFNAGALAIEFDDPPGKFVVSPNTPVRQIWVSALSRSYKLDWVPDRLAFVLAQTGETLQGLIQTLISAQLNRPVEL